MFSCRSALTLAGLLLVMASGDLALAQTASFPGVGRAATAKEIVAWDIDVRPDFKGLPPGAGTVAKGMDVWETKCASCHGIFGESNEFFAAIVGGTTKDDVRTGRVARLNDASYPGRTTLMKLSSVSTLWDYINRAMPWTQPKSLTTEEVYGVTAYILNMGGLVPDNFTLSDKNIAEVQRNIPNRHGMTTDHALWPGAGMGQRKPDVAPVACMKDCVKRTELASFLPEFARDAHGNLADQNRPVGAQKGAHTVKPGTQTPSAVKAAAVSGSPVSTSTANPNAPALGASAIALAQKHSCMACHGMDTKIVGPSFREVSKKYAGGANALVYVAGKIKGGSNGVWGAIPMPVQSISDEDAKIIARWLADGIDK